MPTCQVRALLQRRRLTGPRHVSSTGHLTGSQVQLFGGVETRPARGSWLCCSGGALCAPGVGDPAPDGANSHWLPVLPPAAVAGLGLPVPTGGVG